MKPHCILLVAGVILPASQKVMAQEALPLVSPDPTSIGEALEQGTYWADLRLRSESVNTFGLDDRSQALTLGAHMGFSSAAWKGVRMLAEFESIASLGATTYNDTLNGQVGRPVIADPTGSQVNRIWAEYAHSNGTSVRFGRQAIELDDGRFLGSELFRQGQQTFDAWNVEYEDFQEQAYTLAYLFGINGPLGTQSPTGNVDSGSLVLHMQRMIGDSSSLSAYWLDLDLDNPLLPSTRTFGARFSTEAEVLGQEADLLVEFAEQRENADNPADLSASYSHIALGYRLGRVRVGAGAEILGGDGSPGGSFSTPLASAHTFNGWADAFLRTPDTGLEDTYLRLETTLADVDLSLSLHEFRSNSAGLDFGSELDLAASYTLENGMQSGFALADYSADRWQTDTFKVWVWLGYSF